MTWFKVDDSFYDHPKMFDAPDAAVALWTRAGSWSARNLQDGFVPAGMPQRLCDDPEKAIEELINRGVWRRTRGGYQFHDWLHYNPSKDKVLADRAKDAEKKRQARAALAQKRRSTRPRGTPPGLPKDSRQDSPGESPSTRPGVLPSSGPPAGRPGSAAAGSGPAELTAEQLETNQRGLQKVRAQLARAAGPPPGAAPAAGDAPPRCPDHADLQPADPVPRCRDCAELRRAWSARASQRNRAELRRRRACPACDDDGWALDPDGTPSPQRCPHPSPDPVPPPTPAHDQHEHHETKV
ncbi:hypothetical protein ACFQE5_04775 [Pseudonocardia hispaniensis]|uniref:Helix-turn-helix protein n=1 Tax=Pseudonocardia hispaniensis TaxID=904933 RepID=A0ABW1IYR8_9PSEU